MTCLLNSIREIFPNDNDPNNNNNGNGENDNDTRLHCGFSEDLLDYDADNTSDDNTNDDNTSVNNNTIVSRNVEQEVIDQTLDKELQAYLGLTGEEREEEDDDYVVSENYDRKFDGSIAGLHINQRIKHVRKLVAKIHNFQINSNHDDGGIGFLPPISKANVLTGVLGGEAGDGIPSRFFNNSGVSGGGGGGGAKKAKKNSSTQTDLWSSAPKKSVGTFLTGGSSRNGDDAESVFSKLRKNLHQGVNSPAYSHQNMLTIKDNSLTRNFSRPVKGAHKPLPRPERQPTPEVKGWKGGNAGNAKDTFNKGRKVGGKGNRKQIFSGNQQVYEERMNALASNLLNAANIKL